MAAPWDGVRSHDVRCANLFYVTSELLAYGFCDPSPPPSDVTTGFLDRREQHRQPIQATVGLTMLAAVLYISSLSDTKKEQNKRGFIESVS